MSRKSVIPLLDARQCLAAPGRDSRADERRDLHPSNAATCGIVKTTIMGDSPPRPATRPPRTIDIGCATGSISRCRIRQEPTRRYQSRLTTGRAREESTFGSRKRMAEQAVSSEPFSPRSCLFSGKNRGSARVRAYPSRLIGEQIAIPASRPRTCDLLYRHALLTPAVGCANEIPGANSVGGKDDCGEYPS